MSTFMVEDETINKIVSFISLDEKLKWYLNGVKLDTETQQEEFGKRLFQLNIDGVNARYGEGEAEKFRPLDYKYRFVLPRSSINTLKALQCLIYQCSEGNVPETDLYKLLKRIEYGIMSGIVSRLPEYDQAKWG